MLYCQFGCSLVSLIIMVKCSWYRLMAVRSSHPALSFLVLVYYLKLSCYSFLAALKKKKKKQ